MSNPLSKSDWQHNLIITCKLSFWHLNPNDDPWNEQLLYKSLLQNMSLDSSPTHSFLTVTHCQEAVSLSYMKACYLFIYTDEDHPCGWVMMITMINDFLSTNMGMDKIRVLDFLFFIWARIGFVYLLRILTWFSQIPLLRLFKLHLI